MALTWIDIVFADFEALVGPATVVSNVDVITVDLVSVGNRLSCTGIPVPITVGKRLYEHRNVSKSVRFEGWYYLPLMDIRAFRR